MSNIWNRNRKIAFILIFPQLFITLLFFLWPASRAIFQSFFFSDAFGLHSTFAGFANFIDLLDDPGYFKAIWVTFVLTLCVTFLTLSFGLLIALLVYYRQKGQSLYKSLLLWPYAIAPAVAAILWRFLCEPNTGWLVHLLHWFNIHLNYLVNPKQALALVIVASSWQQFSYNFLFFFAALKAIPVSLIEAAIVDGANGWRRFWQIIFPLLSPVTFFLLILNILYAFFDTFGIIDVMTHGGPGNSTSTLVYKVYQDGFVNMDPGSSAAQSLILMCVIIMLVFLQFGYLEKKVSS